MRITKRITLTQNMTLMAIMAGINVVIALLATFFPVASVFLMILLPLTSVIITLFCRERFFPIYAVATICLCLLVTIFNMEFTIFYIIPSIATGFVFGLLVKYSVHTAWIVFLTSIVQFGLTYATIPLINWMFSTDLIKVFKTAFALQDSVYIDTIVPTFIFMCALAQMAFSYIAISSEIKKFNYSVNTGPIKTLWFALYSSIAYIIMLVSVFFYPAVSYLFMCFGLFFTFYLLIDLLKAKNVYVYLSLGLSFLLTFFMFGLFYNSIPLPNGLLLISIFFVAVVIISLIYFLYLSYSKKHKIVEQGESDD